MAAGHGSPFRVRSRPGAPGPDGRTPNVLMAPATEVLRMARRTGRVIFGAALTLAGTALAIEAWVNPSQFPFDVRIAWGAAGALYLLGLTIAFTGRRGPQPEASIPAHIAFASRTAQDLVPAPRAARPATARPQVTDPHLVALQGIDEQIRDITRRINKAGVMLATGKLSGDAYTKYVNELKRQRGALEADRVHLEIRKR